VRNLVDSRIFEQARGYALDRLERELSPHLVYHGIGHTRDEVVPAAEMLAGMEDIRGEPLYLVLTAAWFHDIGHVKEALDHERISVEIAAQVLPTFGYSEGEIRIIRGAILATALPQSPQTPLEEILVDADLDVLGRETFMQRNQDLRCELYSFGKDFTDEQWYANQLDFIQGHQYFTASARVMRNRQKSLNINDLQNTLRELAKRQ